MRRDLLVDRWVAWMNDATLAIGSTAMRWPASGRWGRALSSDEAVELALRALRR